MANAATMLYMKYDRVRLTVDEAARELVLSPRRTVEDWEAGKRRIPPMAWELLQIKLKGSAA